ncbi:hypothetical protein LMH87_002902 [Akanthomyces muscarius]|uniref:TauD/TfdA-like domain-containing protein n=1 Tax=Akanthomyces muscarius TaxID=2231603 RepID=A0A9W8UK46_AKAMU|nr:hypothetical protein LMH87_002902 [Akanthomyces muscarius]KAJ4148433.1 hypothetical protein LMH87_002902 [Akanthomyces muscarius]
MLSPGRVLMRKAPRLRAGLITTTRHSSSSATTSQTTPHEPQDHPGLWETGKNKDAKDAGPSAPATSQPPWRLKELRQQQGHHKQALIRRADLATGPLSYVVHGDRIAVRSQESGASITLDAAALRDGCQCAACKDPSSGQKSFASIEIPSALSIANVREKADGLGVAFENEIPRFVSSSQQHETTVPWESLELAFGARSPLDMAVVPPVFNSVRARAGIVLWDRAAIAQRVRTIDYHAFMSDDGGGDARWAVVLDLVRLGLVYLTNVPRDEASVVRIATRLASIRETFYGRTFDVRAKPNAENVAYTSGYLGLHQDLLYLDPPPKIQILHCLDNSCAGGESLFSDGERAGRLLLNHDAAAAPLRAHPVPYAYTRNGYSYAQRRPLLHYDRDGRFENVFWSPPFQGGRLADEAPLKPWLAGARVFERLINADAAVHQRKMAPGECVLFDNLRVMHGRTAFDAGGGGSRWLRGAYIAQEDFVSIATQIPREMLAERGGDEGVWYEGHEEKLAAHGEWAAEVQELITKET